MKISPRIILDLLIMVFLIAVTHDSYCKAEDFAPEEIYKKVTPSVVTLKTLNKDGSQGIGTAFLISDKGLAATALHNIKDATHVYATFSSGEEFEVSGLVDKDDTRDVAIIKIKVFGKPYLELEPTDPSIGSRSYIVGAPLGLEFSISDGLVSQIQIVEKVKYYQFTCDASPGNSGGPLINTDGKVIGVVSWRFSEGQNLNFAVPSSYVMGLDSSLPTKQWSDIEVSKSYYQQVEEYDVEKTDALFGKVAVQLIENTASILATDSVFQTPLVEKTSKWYSMSDKYRFNIPTVPTFVYSSMEKSNSLLEKMIAMGCDGERCDLKEELISIIEKQIGVFDLIIKCVETVGREKQWTTQSQNLYSKVIAEHSSISTEPITSLIISIGLHESEAFISNIPYECQFILGIKDDTTGYKLGVFFFPQDSLSFTYVWPQSFAYELGIRTGDKVVSTDKNEIFHGVSDFKKYIKDHIGEQIFIIVIRNAKEERLKIRLPRQIPAKYIK